MPEERVSALRLSANASALAGLPCPGLPRGGAGPGANPNMEQLTHFVSKSFESRRSRRRSRSRSVSPSPSRSRSPSMSPSASSSTRESTPVDPVTMPSEAELPHVPFRAPSPLPSPPPSPPSPHLQVSTTQRTRANSSGSYALLSKPPGVCMT